MKKVLITGGSGLIGKRLTVLLQQEGFEVVHLSRRENLTGSVKIYRWDIAAKYIDERCMEGVTDIVHLAGEGIADKRWSEKRKQEITDSRTISTNLLMEAMSKTGTRINSFTGASAIGIYGAVTGEKIFMEQDSPANDFLGACCDAWEKSYRPLIEKGIRTTILRIGVVLCNEGGALVKMAGPVKKGIGSALGSGKQWVPWIDREDMCAIILRSIVNEEMRGVYNCVAPQHQSNAALTMAIAKQLNKKLWAPKVPAFVLKLMFGEMAKMFLEGSRVSCEKLVKEGFEFRYPEIQKALASLNR